MRGSGATVHISRDPFVMGDIRVDETRLAELLAALREAGVGEDVLKSSAPVIRQLFEEAIRAVFFDTASGRITDEIARALAKNVASYMTNFRSKNFAKAIERVFDKMVEEVCEREVARSREAIEDMASRVVARWLDGEGVISSKVHELVDSRLTEIAKKVLRAAGLE